MLFSSCSGETPASPTPVAPPVVVSPLPPADKILNMFVSGGSWIVIGGDPLQMTANFQTSVNPPEFVDDTDHVTWSVDPSGILTVDRQGKVTAIASGTARVIATAAGRSAFANVRAVPDFTGNWSGNFIITGCTGHYDFRGCPRMMFSQSDGSRIQYAFSLSLSQVQDQVTGTLREIFTTATRETPMRGFVRLSGALVMEASVPQPEIAPLQILNWSSTINAARTQMSGGFTKIEPRRDSFVGNYTLRTENEFSGVTRTP